MSWLTDLRRRFGWSRGGREIAEDVSQEIRFHIDQYAADRVAEGADPDSAHRDALERFGDPDRHAREAAREDLRFERRRRLGRFLDTGYQDLRGALRGMARRPVFTAGILFTLMVGIGVNVAVFAVVHPVVLRPLPFPEPDRLLQVWNDYPNNISKREWVVMREHSEVFEDMAFFSGWGFTVTGEEEPVFLSGVFHSTNLLEMLGIRPLVGTLPDASAMEPGTPQVALMSERLWRGRYGSDPGVLGRTLRLNNTPFLVIGVVDTRLDVLSDLEVDIIAPMKVDPGSDDYRNSYYLGGIARLAEGYEPAAAGFEMERLAAVLDESFEGFYDSDFGQRVRAVDLRTARVGDARTPLLILLAAVGFVLLVVCVNLAGLMLARAIGRSREISVRTALGAGRLRILRQMLTETLTLGVLGGALGLAAGIFISGVLKGMLPEWVPRTEAIGISTEVVLFAALLAAFTGLAVGLIPGLRLAARPAAEALRGDSPGSGPGGSDRWTTLLVCGEVALAAVLAVSAGLMVRSYSNLTNQSLGFEASRVLSATVAFDTGEDVAARFDEVLDRLRANPQVEAVGGIHLEPIGSRGNWNYPIVPEGQGLAPEDPKPNVNFRVVVGDYFRAMGIPLLKGRILSPEDRADSEPAALVNASFAERFWPGEDPIGREIRMFWEGGQRQVVVGVVGDIRQHSVSEPPRPEFYLSNRQWPLEWSNLMIRHRAEDPALIADILRGIVREVDGQALVANVFPLSEVVRHSLSQERLGTVLLSLFAVIALLLGMVGILGVVSFSVNRRTREFGIRMALGARAVEVLRGVMFRTLRAVSAGLLLGLGGSWLAAHGIQNLLYGVAPIDGAVYAIVPALFLLTSLAAVLPPALRAASTDPARTLRDE